LNWVGIWWDAISVPAKRNDAALRVRAIGKMHKFVVLFSSYSHRRDDDINAIVIQPLNNILSTHPGLSLRAHWRRGRGD
jgi:uncharacterized DUF497 family protein